MMGDPDYCEKKCPICSKARRGHRLARFFQSIEMLVTFGGYPRPVTGGIAWPAHGSTKASRCRRKGQLTWRRFLLS